MKEEKQKVVYAKVGETFHRQLKALSAHRGVTLNEFVVECLEKAMKEMSLNESVPEYLQREG